MAGSLPDVTANRMLLDRDGSTLFVVNGADRVTLTPEQVLILNNEASDDLGVSTDIDAYLLAFPELRDVQGLYLGFAQEVSADWVDVTVSGSRDTTDGEDGTWAEVFPVNRVNDGTTAGWWGHTATGDYRRYIRLVSTPAAATGLRALRIEVTPQTPGSTAWRLKSLHCFGVPAFEANPHRLAIWHPWLDQRVPGGHFDWGNAPLSSSADKTFRVANLSFARTARTITVSVDALTDATPSVPPQMMLSYGGSAFSSNVTIPQLAPAARSNAITVRRVTPSDADPGPWAQRILAGAAVWVELP
ncbi:MAG TPA: hypothetical protein VIT65_22330 [Microlunatus sp.]